MLKENFTLYTDRLTFHRGLKALFPLAAKPSDRPHLAGVAVGLDLNGNIYLAATDGHCAGRLSIGWDDTDTHKDNPNQSTHGHDARIEVLIPSESVKALISTSWLKSAVGNPTVALSIVGNSLVVTVGTMAPKRSPQDTELRFSADPSCQICSVDRDMAFPDMTAIWGIPNCNDAMPFGAFSPKLLATALKAFTAMKSAQVTVRSIDHEDNLQPYCLSAMVGNESNLQVIVMPMRGDMKAPWGIVPTASDATKAA